MTRIGVLALIIGAFVGACSDERPTASTNEPIDERASRTATENLAEDSVAFDLEAVRVESGTESMFCHYLPPLERDLVVRGFSTHQGAGGHHLVIYRALEPKPAGTVEDCSTGESMANLMLVLTQTGTQEPGASAIMFPERHVVVLEAGLQLVAQSHYVNTSDTVQTTKDDLTVFTTTADLSTLTQLHLLVVSSSNFEIPARTPEYSASAGCVLDKNIQLLSLVPHMHEWGARIDLRAGEPAAMSRIMAVADWTADMRDLPPITSFSGMTAPMNGRLSAGDSVALTCTWRNAEDHAIAFPAEMCAAVGYFTTADVNATDIMCLNAL